jgi:hypothetical protein
MVVMMVVMVTRHHNDIDIRRASFSIRPCSPRSGIGLHMLSHGITVHGKASSATDVVVDCCLLPAACCLLPAAAEAGSQ